MTFIPAIALLWTLQAPASASASISGIVVRAVTNEPIPRARISIFRSDVPAGLIPSVTSDDQGRFVFKDLNAGMYALEAQRNGFARQPYGQREPGRGGGTPVTVAAGQAVNDVVFRLVPAAALSGRVSDATGEPLLGVNIQILRATYDANGKRTLGGVGVGRVISTDDRGEYRVYLLPPGRYYVKAVPNLSFVGETTDGSYVTTYYPNTTDSSSAAPIELAPGAEVHAIDITLSEQKLFRLRGRVFDPKVGKPPLQAQIRLIPRNSESEPPHGQLNYNPGNGIFELPNVPSGSYWITATELGFRGRNGLPGLPPGSTDVSSRSARVAIDISNSDLDNIVLNFPPDVSIRGRITIDDGSALTTSPDISAMTLDVESAEISTQSHPFPSPIKPDGTFVIENIQPGEYQFALNGPLPPNYYLKSARLGGTDALRGLIISGPVSDDLELVLATDAGRIEGTLVEVNRKPVSGVVAVLIPDVQRDRRDLYKTYGVDQNGHFTMYTVVPGNYKLFAWEDSEAFAYMDPDFLRKYEESGTPVRVSASEAVTVEAKVIPAGQ